MSNHIYTTESPPKQSDKFEFLNLRLLPGKVDYRQAGYILAFEPVAIQRLVALGYLKPLGNNAGTEHKYFSTQTILECARDAKWMDIRPNSNPCLAVIAPQEMQNHIPCDHGSGCWESVEIPLAVFNAHFQPTSL